MRQALAPGCRAFTLMVAALLLGTAVFLWARFVEPHLLTVTRQQVAVKSLPEGMSGTKIALLTDLHGAQFGEGQARIAAVLRQAAPQAIVFAGDLVDANHGGLAQGMELLSTLADIAPTYVVWGNHDYIAGLEEIRDAITARGINVTDLDNAWATLDVPGGKLLLAGLTRSWRSGANGLPALASAARQAAGSDHAPLIAVLHSPGPGPIADAQSAGADLILAGHTHGGQIRLPFLGAIWSPVDGFFSRAAYGFRELEQGCLFISRGLGTSVWPLRFLCPPEVVILTLTPTP